MKSNHHFSVNQYTAELQCVILHDAEFNILADATTVMSLHVAPQVDLGSLTPESGHAGTIQFSRFC